MSNKNMLELKNVYRGDEIKFAPMFRCLQKDLLNDFINVNPEMFTEKSFKNLKTYVAPTRDKEKKVVSKDNAWNVAPLVSFNKNNNNIILDQNKKNYKTASRIVNFFGDDCILATYSVFEPNTIVYRHSDVEIRDGKSIRIHIPLYIPKGDIGFEVFGEELYWDDIFGFDVQRIHSLWNNTNERRLIFMLELKRSICEIPDSLPWNEHYNDGILPFEKTQLKI